VFDLVPALERLLKEDLLACWADSDPVPRAAIVIGDPAWLSFA